MIELNLNEIQTVNGGAANVGDVARGAAYGGRIGALGGPTGIVAGIIIGSIIGALWP